LSPGCIAWISLAPLAPDPLDFFLGRVDSKVSFDCGVAFFRIYFFMVFHGTSGSRPETITFLHAGSLFLCFDQPLPCGLRHLLRPRFPPPAWVTSKRLSTLNTLDERPYRALAFRYEDPHLRL